MLLTNLPVPAASLVKLSLIVGFGFKLQQTPLALTSNPLSEVMFPPQIAVFCVIEEIVSVEITGSDFESISVLQLKIETNINPIVIT